MGYIVLLYASCVSSAADIRRNRVKFEKTFGKFEKSAWQTENGVLRYQGCVRTAMSRANAAQLNGVPRALKKIEKSWKKFLTNQTGCAKISRLSDERRKPGGQSRDEWLRQELEKRFKKSEKSTWQELEVVITYKSSRRAMSLARTSLYLVNWITWRRTN